VEEKANSGAKTQQKRRANKFMANFYSKISKVSKLYENEKQNRGLPPPFSVFPLLSIVAFPSVGSQLGPAHVPCHANRAALGFVASTWGLWSAVGPPCTR